MDNPFLKRATELYRDDEAFLAVVSPEPVSSYLGAAGKDGRLYDRLVLLQGTPGSGKTTIARLFEYRTMCVLLKNSKSDYFKSLVASLTDCGAMRNGKPTVVGCRLPLESDYREIWEFPYTDNLKTGLTTTLIQCRAVLSWFRNLTEAGVAIEDIEIVPKSNAVGAIEAMGGISGNSVFERAQSVESSLYKIVAALVPPDETLLDSDTTNAYRPFDVIEKFRMTSNESDLQPLVILDDAHILHPNQYKNIEHWMARRELSVARWILTRLDVMQPEEVLDAAAMPSDSHVELPGITAKRDTWPINLQVGGNDSDKRKKSRSSFRKLGKDISARYLRKMSIFQSRNLASLGDLLSDREISISKSDRTKLASSVNTVQKSLEISDKQRESFEEKISGFRGDLPEDIKLAMLSIMMHRHDKRISSSQKSLFPEDEIEPSRPVVPKTDIVDAARLHLYHRFERPFYFGIDDLCDASSENVEQFLRLAAIFVNASATNIIQNKSPALDTKTQTRLLVQRASQAISDWDFPHCKSIERLVNQIAGGCKKKSLEPNAPLGAGAYAYGILQEEFDAIPSQYPDLARILQFAVSYNAISLAPNMECKKKSWCLLELGGMVLLKHGLTLKRGGFIEGDVNELTKFLAIGGK